MKCVCGHWRNVHTTSGYPHYREYCDSYTCCDRTPARGFGRRGSEHDFVTHRQTRCQCSGFQPNTTKEQQ